MCKVLPKRGYVYLRCSTGDSFKHHPRPLPLHCPALQHEGLPRKRRRKRHPVGLLTVFHATVKGVRGHFGTQNAVILEHGLASFWNTDRLASFWNIRKASFWNTRFLPRAR